MTVIVSLVVALALFAVAYVSRRRFGILGLALAAGALLAGYMTKDLSRLIAQYGVPVEPLSTISAATIFLILLPSMVLFLKSPHYKKRNDAMVGAAEFTVMAMLLLLSPLSSSLPPDRLMQPFLNWVMTYQSGVLALMISLAIVDIWLIRPAPPPEELKKK